MIPATRPGHAVAAPPSTGPAGRLAVPLLVLSPAVVLPGGLDRFVLVKTLAVAVAIGLGLWASPTGRLPRWAVVGLGVGVGWLFLAAVASDAPWAQLWGRWPRYEGLVVLPAYAGALWLGARTLGPGAGRSPVHTLVRAITVLTALVGSVAVIEALGGRPLSGTAARPGSLLGNATEQGIVGLLAAAVLLVAVVAAVAPERSGPRRTRAPIDHVVVLAGALLLAVSTVVLSGSRGALLGLLVAVAVAGGLLLVPGVYAALVADGARPGRAASEARSSGSTRRVAFLGGGVLLGTLVLALTVPAMAARLRGVSPLATGTVEGRRLLWEETIRLVADRPLLGAGPSGFVERIPAFHTETWAILVGPANPPDSPHSWPLQAAVAGGLPLLVLAVLLAVLGVVTAVRALRAATAPQAGRPRSGLTNESARAFVLIAGLAALSGYAVAAGTHFTAAGTTPLAAFLAGAVIAGAPRAGAASDRWMRRAAIGAIAAWGLVLAPAVAAEWSLASAYRALSAGEFASGGTADTAFDRARTLRPWDGDVPVIAAHAFASVALAGATDAAPPARDWADRALAQVPKSATATAAASAAAEVAGDIDRAADLMTQLVDREPTNAEWRLRRGVIHAGAERYTEAERDFLRAAELAPSSPVPWRNLEVLYGLIGDEAAADEAGADAEARTP